MWLVHSNEEKDHQNMGHRIQLRLRERVPVDSQMNVCLRDDQCTASANIYAPHLRVTQNNSHYTVPKKAAMYPS